MEHLEHIYNKYHFQFKHCVCGPFWSWNEMPAKWFTFLLLLLDIYSSGGINNILNKTQNFPWFSNGSFINVILTLLQAVQLLFQSLNSKTAEYWYMVRYKLKFRFSKLKRYNSFSSHLNKPVFEYKCYTWGEIGSLVLA